MDVINVADCCRACLRIDCTLTSTSAEDNDSIKFYDKLVSCVSEVSWLKEGLPSLICGACIERLRIAYDFRIVCLQSDQTLGRYITHLDDNKQNLSLVGRPLMTPTKFEFGLSTSNNEVLPIIGEELHLKHFLDNDEELTKNETLVDTAISRSSTPDDGSSAGIGIGFV
ncbi:hypothetical protein NQ315_011208 [Exocentrus adspersus]|uniref:ZAD domain-containing protein n=1 Tax=Exocentrus adspersus TaxID=1586481 RepID=A0AAV8VFE3_9CUCU|nr:hypothetical protein NQ315_011208 [Exocentrus adspersus]